MRLFLALTILLASLSLSACDPPTCGKDHEAWVRATVTNGYDNGSSVTIHDLWTTMGHAPSCTDGWTGNPRTAPTTPYEACMGTCVSSSFPKYANGTWMKTVGDASFYDSDVEIYLLAQGSQVSYNCSTIHGPATLSCEGHLLS